MPAGGQGKAGLLSSADGQIVDLHSRSPRAETER